MEAGGGKRDRTDDPLLAKQVLSQLSYTPNKNFGVPPGIRTPSHGFGDRHAAVDTRDTVIILTILHICGMMLGVLDYCNHNQADLD